jgi:hypothetical protein
MSLCGATTRYFILMARKAPHQELSRLADDCKHLPTEGAGGMISSLQSEERVNRSHQHRGADDSSAQIALVCFSRVAKRDQQFIAWLSSPPQSPLKRRAFGAALRRRVLVNINHRSLEA